MFRWESIPLRKCQEPSQSIFLLSFAFKYLPSGTGKKKKIIILKRPFHPMKRFSIHMEIVILAPPLKSLSVVSPGQRRMEVANQNSHSSKSEAFSPQSLVRSQSWYCKKEWGIWSQEIWMWVCSTTSSPWRCDQITTSQDVSFVYESDGAGTFMILLCKPAHMKYMELFIQMSNTITSIMGLYTSWFSIRADG